jgi:hypothetical protein
MDMIVFLMVRALHVVLSGLWLGAGVLLSSYLVPLIQQEGVSAGRILSGLVRRGLVTYMAVVGGTTVLTGIYLYWRFTDGFEPALATSRAGLMFGLGGLLGLVAVMVGGTVIGRAARRGAQVMDRAAGLPDGPERASVLREGAVVLDRLAGAGRLVSGLLVAAMVLMALGHYG